MLMIVDPHITKLGDSLLETDVSTVENALQKIEELLSSLTDDLQVETSVRMTHASTRAFLRSRLQECINADPLRPIASTAIWVLGKLYDNTLEPYFAGL